MEFITHIIGVCSDTHSHIDMIDFLIGSSGVGVFYMYTKYYIKGILTLIKKQFKF
jgi:hypothetical protein